MCRARWLVILPLIALACAPDDRPASVLLLTVDTLRPDYLSVNGYPRPTTPHLDVLIAESFYFERAVAPVARTTPALASLLTGTYPHRNRVRTLTGRLAPGLPTLPQILRERGYQTVAVVTNQLLTRERDLDRGFSIYRVAHDSRPAAETTEDALRFVAAADPSRPLFAWVHYIDPHVPYHPDPDSLARFAPGYRGRYRDHFGYQPRPGEGRRLYRPFPEDLPKPRATHRNPLSEAENEHIRTLYAAQLPELDAQIGRLLDAFRTRFPDGIVVFAADHGESLGEHDFYFDHGDYVYNAGTRVPLAFRLPDSHPLRGSGRCGAWVSLVDVAPTVIELLGIPPDSILGPSLEGRSLAPCLRGAELPEVPVYAESGHPYYPELVRGLRRPGVAGRFRSVVRGDWKLIWTPFAPEDEAYELYDVARDPEETRNLYAPDHPAVAGLRDDLAAWLARASDETSGAELSERDREALRALGYLE